MRFQSGMLLPCLREYPLKPNHLMLFKDNGYGVRSMYERIRNMREDKDMTQADMAAYLNIHQTTYSDYELGIMRSSFIAFTGTAALYGVAMEGAVKVWEAPQYPSAGYELDEGMHGPNYGYNGQHAVIVLSGGGRGSDQALALARYMKNEHDNGYVFGVGAMDDKDLAFKPAGGAFECLEFAAAIQTFMYRLAVDGGRDFSILGVHAKMNSYFQSHS